MPTLARHALASQSDVLAPGSVPARGSERWEQRGASASCLTSLRPTPSPSSATAPPPRSVLPASGRPWSCRRAWRDKDRTGWHGGGRGGGRRRWRRLTVLGSHGGEDVR
eukprot:2477258-Rhodomonas_salina.1